MSFKKGASLALFLLLACSNRTGDERPPAATETQTSAPIDETRTFSRTLDFDSPRIRGALVYQIDYGPRRSQAGAHDVCTSERCPRPCPCTQSGGPMSFDIDGRGRLWLLDVVKERVAVFAPNGLVTEEYFPDGNDFRDLDLQLRGEEALVHRQGGGLEAQLISIRNGAVGPVVTVRAAGETVSSVGFIQIGPEGINQIPPTEARPGFRGGVYAELYESPSDSVQCCFGPAELLTSEDASSAEAVHAPGLVPFLDGWFTSAVRRSRIFRLEANSSSQEWTDEIAFRFVQRVSGEKRRVRGTASYESEISADGTVHMLIFAGTDLLNGPNEDGYWYLSIAPDGTPGRVVHLQAPDPRSRRPNPGVQLRHLTLDEHGSPLLMWVGAESVQVTRVPQ